jgi:uncharacterized protein YjbI with pentapeptide repeats
MAENDDLVMIRNSKGEVLLQLVARSGVPKYKDFHDQELSDEIFDGLILEGAHFVGSNLARASFRNADLYWAMFIMANLEGASFREADSRGADFKEANLQNCCLFLQANLGRDNLGGNTTFDGADLRGADVRATDLINASFQEAVYDSKTQFPTAFRPKDHGLILVQK